MKEKGVFIPNEFYKDKNLNGLERDVLALYKYYTENGNNKCCSLNSVQIAEYFNVSSRYIKSVRKYLKELGYIRTNGGIKVVYVGIKGEPQFPPKGTTVPPKVNHSSPQKGTTVPPKGEPQFPHKDIDIDKKDKKREMTNFDRLIGLLPEEYVTPERLEYIEEKYKDRINELDMTGGVIDGWIINIKNELNKVFPVEFHIEKEEKKSDTIDVI